MTIRDIRTERGLSQEQLAHMAGISPRTLQRIENGATPSAETLKCLASALDLKFEDLREDTAMAAQDTTPQFSNADKEMVLEDVKKVRGFFLHIALAVLGSIAFFIMNLMVSPWYLWAVWASMGVAISATIHGILVFDILFRGWERRQVEARLKR